MVSSQLAKLRSPRRSWRFTYQAASVEQGKEVDLVVKVAKAVDFEGKAKVTLLGLPNKVTTDVEDDHQGHDGAGLPRQDRRGLAGRQPREPVLPGGRHAERRADRAQHSARASCGSTCRCRPRPNAPPTPVAAAAAQPPRRRRSRAEKRLTRLEKLRLEKQERDKAASAEPPQRSEAARPRIARIEAETTSDCDHAPRTTSH